MEWINVKQKLPNENEHVIVFSNNGDGICVAFRRYDIWCVFPVCYEDSGIFSVTHWMPLPEAPKE